MGLFQNWPIRLRLTVSYVAVLLAIIFLFIGGTSLVLYWQLRTQLFRFAINDIETVEGLLSWGPDGAILFDESYHNHPESRLVLERLLEVLSPDGKVLFLNQRLHGELLGDAPFPDEGVGGYSPRRIRLQSGRSVLLVSRRHLLHARPVLIRVGYTEDTIQERVENFLMAAFLALPISLAVAGILAYQLAKKSLAPVEEMARQAGEITAAELDRRLPVPNPNDELGQLASVINRVLDRLQQSFEQLRRFTSDASHELRTPLAAIRSVGEVGLQRNRNAHEYQETIGSMLEEVNRLTRLVDSLLTMSRADAAQIKPVVSIFELSGLVREVVNVIEVLAEEKGQKILLNVQAKVEIEADPLLLRQAVLNVLHNAVKFSHAGELIHVQVNRDQRHAQITISDSGPGIPAEHRTRIFDRFYRVDPARARDTGGAGLGLSIAQWALQVQGGSIHVLDSKEGASFLLLLPLRSV